MKFRFDFKENNWVLQVTILSVVLGMLLAAALKTQTSIRTNSGIPTTRFPGLAEAFLGEKERNKVLRGEIADLRAKLSGYEEVRGQDTSKTQLLKSELENVKLLAGLSAAEGPGVEVTLRDSPKKPPADTDPFLLPYYNVHEQDIQDFVNVLFANGAEAISIKDSDSEQRIIVTSSVMCTNGTIRVDGVGMGSPFTIRAIGAPDVLESALRMNGGLLDRWRSDGLPLPRGLVDSMVRLEKKSDIALPAYSGPTRLIYAHSPAEGKER